MEQTLFARDMGNLGTCWWVHSLIGGHGNDSEARRTGFLLFLVLGLWESCESFGHLGAAHVCVVLELSAARISIFAAGISILKP